MKRRRFVQKSVASATGIGLGGAAMSWSGCRRREANDQVVIALIGAGQRGRSLALNICLVGQGAALKTVCDINDYKADATIQLAEESLGYRPERAVDMRQVLEDKEVDAVIIATPEHWHALATIRALQAGKHVYVEKNPTLTIWEGQKIIEAAEKYKRVVQVGFQNRSAAYGYSAREFIQSGRLGQVVHVKSHNMLGGSKWMPQPDAGIPDGLDWDAWLGPAPHVPYNPGIHDMKGRGGWYNYWAYGGGVLADDASHVLDLARMVLGDPGHPASVYCLGGNWAWGSEKEVPEFQAITYNFESFTWTCESGNATNYMKKTAPEIRKSSDAFPSWRQNATRTEIYGTEGMMYLGRHGGGWQVVGPGGEIIDQAYGQAPDTAHLQNFIDCIRSRAETNCSPLQGHLSATLVHLANISYRTGNRQVDFDGSEEQIINSEDANALIRSSYRKGYEVPATV